MNCAGPGHLKGGAGEAEVTAVVPGRDGGGGEVEQSGNPVGEVSTRTVATRHVRAVSGGEAAYRAGRGGRAQPECVLVGGHVEMAQVMLAGTIQYNKICIYLLDEETLQAQKGMAGKAGQFNVGLADKLGQQQQYGWIL